MNISIILGNDSINGPLSWLEILEDVFEIFFSYSVSPSIVIILDFDDLLQNMYIQYPSKNCQASLM